MPGKLTGSNIWLGAANEKQYILNIQEAPLDYIADSLHL